MFFLKTPVARRAIFQKPLRTARKPDEPDEMKIKHTFLNLNFVLDLVSTNGRVG
jgi:hypothetical protein